MSLFRHLLPALLLAGPAAAAAAAYTYSAPMVVHGGSNIFAADRDSTSGRGGGSLPPSSRLVPGEDRTLTVYGVSGRTHNAGGDPAWGPDGFSFDVDINSVPGISGLRAGRAMALLGVFLTDDTPSGAAPPTIDFTSGSGVGRNFTTLSPLIGQVFLIGDGHYSSTGRHLYHIPDTATRLFVGFADAGGFRGNPSTYNDNSGVMIGTYSFHIPDPVPEPSAAVLLGAVCGLTLTARRRR